MRALLDTHVLLWWATDDHSRLSRYRVVPLTIRDNHGFRAGGLPPHHRDPFDRMLVAQAQLEGLKIISADTLLDAYEVELIR